MGLKTFKKGIHPPTNKELTASIPVEVLPLPDQVVLPLGQHIGAPAKPLGGSGGGSGDWAEDRRSTRGRSPFLCTPVYPGKW